MHDPSKKKQTRIGKRDHTIHPLFSTVFSFFFLFFPSLVDGTSLKGIQATICDRRKLRRKSEERRRVVYRRWSSRRLSRPAADASNIGRVYLPVIWPDAGCWFIGCPLREGGSNLIGMIAR